MALHPFIAQCYTESRLEASVFRALQDESFKHLKGFFRLPLRCHMASTFDGNKLVATEQDAKPHENILPFGSCKAKNYMPCSPITQKWNKTAEKDTINDLKILLETSECSCKIGGKITILDKGHQGKIEAE